MNTNDLITFIRASELLNFSKTAEELNYSQSTVTIQIKKLEKEFNVQLFNRIGKNLSLTPAGKQFLSHAHNIVNSVKHAKEAMGTSNIDDSIVRIGCIDSLSNHHMPELLNMMSENNLKINIKVITGSPKKLFEMLDKNLLDLVYIFDNTTYSDKWEKVFEIEEKLNFVSSVKSLHNKKLKITDIVNYNFYLTETLDNYRYALDQKLAEHSIEILPSLEISNTDIILNLLKQKNGISYLPSFVYYTCVNKSKIKVLDVEDFELTMSRQLFYHKAKFITNEMKSIIDLIKKI